MRVSEKQASREVPLRAGAGAETRPRRSLRRRDLFQLTAAVLATGAVGCVSPSPVATPPSPGTTSSFTSSSGLRSSYRLHKPAGDDSSKGIVIYLHGDGYGEFEPGATAIDDYATVAGDHGLFLAAPVTPDKATGTWWRAETSGQWLREFIEYLGRTLPVDTSRVWLVGYSGGAEAITNILLPHHSDLFAGGGALMIGGGSLDPEVEFTLPLSRQLRAGFLMTWLVGELDTPAKGGADGNFDALGESRAAEQAYRELGMSRTALKVLPGETHDSSIRHGAGVLRDMLGR